MTLDLPTLNARRWETVEYGNSESVVEDDDKGGVASCVTALMAVAFFRLAILAEGATVGALSSVGGEADNFEELGLGRRRFENCIDGGVRVRGDLRWSLEEA